MDYSGHDKVNTITNNGYANKQTENEQFFEFKTLFAYKTSYRPTLSSIGKART